MGVEQEQAGDVLLARGELDRAAIVLGLGRLVDGVADLLALDDAGFRAKFAGSPIKRIGVARMIRNCLIAAGNSGSARLLSAVERHRGSDDPVVADAARWAYERLTRL